jgi:hypothetical protein
MVLAMEDEGMAKFSKIKAKTKSAIAMVPQVEEKLRSGDSFAGVGDEAGRRRRGESFRIRGPV